MDEVRRFIDFLYDACPCWPDACTRDQLLALYEAWLEMPEEDTA